MKKYNFEDGIIQKQQGSYIDMLQRAEVIPFSSLYEVATPSTGSYKDHIGSVKYTTPDGITYNTLIMTKTDPEFKVRGKKYPMIAGYIQIKPFIDAYLQKHPGTQTKEINKWHRFAGAQKFIKSITDSHSAKPASENAWSLSIMGSSEIKGTYFHPLIFTFILKSACPAFEHILSAEFESQIVQQNQDIKAQATMKQDTVLQESALTLQNLQQYEVNAPYMFEEQLPSDSEEEEKKEFIPQSVCIELEDQIKQLQLQMDESNDLNEFRSLVSKQSALKDELREYEKKAALQQEGAIYTLNWRSDNSVMYVGLTEQTGKGLQAAPQIRFKQHKQKVVDVFKNSDIAHIVLAGEVAKYMIQRKITKVSTDIVDAIVYPTFVCGAKYNPGELQDIETAKIQQYIKEGHIIYNSKKRVEVDRSNSKNTSRNESLDDGINSRLQRMRDASQRSDAISIPRPVAEVRQQYIQEKFILHEVEETEISATKKEKQKRQVCVLCNKMLWFSQIDTHICKSVTRPNIHKK